MGQARSQPLGGQGVSARSAASLREPAARAAAAPCGRPAQRHHPRRAGMASQARSVSSGDGCVTEESGTAAAAAAAPAAAPDALDAGEERLSCFLADRGITASLVPALDGAATPAGCVELKSLIYLVGSTPLAVVLPLTARVDDRRLAALLHVGRSRLRMVPAAALQELCGYDLGGVPPLGHSPRLPVIVDSSVERYATCYAGGGSERTELLISVAELLRASGATVADITSSSSGSSGSGSGSGDSAAWHSGSGAAAPGEEAAATATLPLPWQPGAVDVTLEGVVAHRRKIARLLLFANLVPLEAAGQAAAAPSPKPGTAALVRRLWRHPDTQRPTEVQLILGGTLARNLGADAAAELFRVVKAGQRVRIRGRVQPHVRKATAAGDSFEAAAAAAAAEAAAAAAARDDVCDVVVHELQVLPEPPAVAAAAADTKPASNGAPAATPAPTGAAPSAACYQLPPAVEERLVLIDSEEGLAQLEAALFGGADSGADGGSSNGSGEGEAAPRGFGPPGVAPPPASFRLVVGLDAEWQPYASRWGEAKTPVALVQLATPDAVFLLDMLALLPSSKDAAAPSSSGGASSSGEEVDAVHWLPPQAPQVELSSAERRLSDLFARLWGDAGIVKAGFGLESDISRLCESYPWLPCFGSQGPVPLRCHVDVLLLARTAMGSALPTSRRRISLSALAEAVLGCPIDKSEQVSAWGQRPLRREQLLYAAADAHALVALYAALHKRRRGLDTLFWATTFAGHLVDVADFHPRNRRPKSDLGRRRRSFVAGDGDASVAASPRHSSVPRRPPREPREPGEPSAEGGRGSETLQLDMHVEYLLNSYLGRQLPQGGKSAAVRAAAAHTGRPESGRTPSFPRGCGGLLEWRNGHMLFVNLPEVPHETTAGDECDRQRRSMFNNQFMWLPPGPPTGLAEQQQPGPPTGLDGDGSPDDQTPEAVEGVLAAAAGAAEHLAAGERLCLTWWAGRGQMVEHPVMQRLLAASTAAPAAADGAPATVVEEPAAAPASTPQQAAVLLFCRAGGGPFVFCGRLRPAVVGIGGEGARGVSIVWELTDAASLIGGGGGDAFWELLPSR